MRQMALQFGSAGQTQLAEDYSLTEANQPAYQIVMQAAWPQSYMVLSGPSGSGKTHLASVWAASVDALKVDAGVLDNNWVAAWQASPKPLVIDSLENLKDEAALFHLLNLSKETMTPVLVVGVDGSAQAITLPDLKSRLLAAPHAMLQQPDDELLRILFIKHFSDRQLQVSPDILQYLVNHVERSGKAVMDAVRVIDEQALEKKQKISVAFLRKHLLG